jgi:ArsR family transcriptional regulator, arsenate/arsenite/antimonite-responsive transcriptional repressor
VSDPVDRLAKAFKALSHPNRLRIYTEILKQESARIETGCGCFVTEVVRSLRVGAPTISHHVKELVNADLITVERQGKFLVCKVNPKTAALVRDLLQ